MCLEDKVIIIHLNIQCGQIEKASGFVCSTSQCVPVESLKWRNLEGALETLSWSHGGIL